MSDADVRKLIGMSEDVQKLIGMCEADILYMCRKLIYMSKADVRKLIGKIDSDVGNLVGMRGADVRKLIGMIDVRKLIDTNKADVRKLICMCEADVRKLIGMGQADIRKLIYMSEARSWLGGMELEVFFKVYGEIWCKFGQETFICGLQKPVTAFGFRPNFQKRRSGSGLNESGSEKLV